MNNAKKHFGKRMLAIFLSLLTVFSMAPLNVFVAFATGNGTEGETENTSVFTVLVTDGKNPVSGAVVTLKNDGAQLDDSATTNSEGKAEFKSVAALESTFEGEGSDFICKYTVTAEGYDLATGEFCPADEGGWSGEKEISLTKTIQTIPESDYKITAYNSTYDTKEHDAVKVVAEGYTVEYKVGEKDYTATVPTVKDVAELEFKVKISKEGYKDKIVDVKAVVLKADREFAFGETSPANLTYQPGGVKYTNTAESEQEAKDVVYSVDDSSIADIDSKTGELTLKNIGTVEVTATMASSDNYNESIAKYKITLVAADRDFGFTNDAPSDITYDPDNVIFSNTAVNKENVGKVTYSIKSQKRDGKDVDDVATINENTGEIKINASGTIVVKAVVESAGNYNDDNATYTLTINRAKQNLQFESKNKNGLVYKETFKNPLSGGMSEGAVVYEVTQQISSTDEDNVVTVDENGNVTAVGIGSATIKATKPADARYEEASAAFNVTTVRAQQKNFKLGEDKTVCYGTKEATFVAEGNETSEAVKYSLVFPDGVDAFAEIDEDTGKITFEDKKVGSFTLKAENPGNDFYESAEATCVVTVEEKDFSVNRTIIKEGGNNGWFISDYKIIPSDGFKIGYNNSFGDEAEWLDEIVISKEGTTSAFGYYIKETKTGYIGKVIVNPEVSIDKGDPTLEISYSESANSLLKKLFYKDKVTVTLTSKDDISGIEKFAYSINGSDKVDVTGDKIVFDEDKQVYFYAFDIEAQYNGKVTANAVDFSGRKASENDLIDDGKETEIVVDNIAPNATISFEDTVVGNDGYYSAKRKATIKVIEKNFFAEDVVISLSKRYNNEAEYKLVDVNSYFKAVDGEVDAYEAVIEFNEDADYILDIKYTDKSGNTYEYDEDIRFTVDTIAPVISLAYEDGDTAHYYKSDRIAKVTVNEHNFDPAGITLNVSGSATAFDGTINPVELADYQKQLRETDWKKDGDVYVGYVEITDEARYNIELSYTDPAGNVSNVVSDEFVIDKQAPTNLEIKYSEPVNKIQEWFYGDEIEVMISAFDSISGLDGFTYSYIVSDGVSSRNKGKENVEVTADMIVDGAYTFKIPAQFRGCVSFNATDKSANTSTDKNDELVVIADNIAPGVKVVYDNNAFENGKYYKANRTATIEIEEANFWASDVKVYVNGTEEKLSFGRKPDGTNSYVEDTYVAERVFDKDGDYVLKVEYSDRSNNSASYTTPEFVIDKTPAVISIAYDNNTVINSKYFDADRQATLTVNEHNFDPSGLDFTLKAVITNEDGTEKEVVSEAIYDSYLADVNNWSSEGDIHTIVLPEFDVDARYKIDIFYTDLAGNKSNELHEEFVIDKNGPDKLKIEYSEPENFIGKLFFKDEVDVTISAFDPVSGVHSVDYSYPVDEDVSSINKGGSNIASFEEGTYNAFHSFRIPAQYRGHIEFDAFDYAENDSYIYDEKVVVVDNIAPGVSVESNAQDDKYYNADREATVTVTEANFWSEDVELIVYRQLDSETEYKKLDETYAFNSVEGKEDTYSAVIHFTENADYKLDIKYTDRSNNVYDNYDEIEFVVDKIAPVIELSYKNDSTPSNVNNYKTNRFPVITVTEHNFDPKDFVLEMTGVVTGDNGQPVTVFTEENGYLAYLQDKSNWKSEGDTHTIEMPELTVDARYTISELSYSDLAGNESNVITDEFVIDKNGPEDLKIIYETTEWYKNLFEIFTLGFYESETTVTIKAVDNVSGLDYFTYSYKIGQGATPVNEGKENVKVTPNADGTYSFDIPAQFRGQVTFTATDKADNKSDEKRDYKVVVVDNTAPEVNVKFDNNEALNGNYYKADRTATITVKEANFWKEDIVITKGTRYNDADKYSYERVEDEFTPVEGKPDEYKLNVLFNEDADYTLDISYKDKSGNKAVYTSNVGEDEETFEKLSFTVDKIAPEISIEFAPDTALNGNQYKANRTATITVKEHNFDAKDIEFALATNNKVGKPVAVSSDDYSIYLKNNDNWTSNGNIHTATIDFDIDAQYILKIYCTDLAGNVSNKLSYEFGIDKQAPENLEIKYAEPRITEIFLEGITFGFYKAPLRVEISAIDEISGVDYFTYSYTVDKGVSADNKGEENITPLSVEDKDRSTVEVKLENGEKKYFEKSTAIFTIDPQFRGKVSFTATDRAGNESKKFEDENTTVVVDNEPPVIKVVYDETSKNGHYKERKATVSVDEANFFAEDVIIKIDRRLDDETEFSRVECAPVFTNLEGTDIYVAEILFNEFNANAEYIFDIDYTDKSGNAAVFDVGKEEPVEDYPGDEFVVDVTYPEITVSYDNNDVRNSSKFKADRTATITITEHKFRSEDVDIVVTAKNAAGEDVEVENYAEYLKSKDSWISEGDLHTAVVKYTVEADYTFDISYTDQAGNKNAPVNYGESVATKKFTIDKTKPTANITVGDWNASKNGTEWNKFLNNVTFSLWSNKSVDVKVNSDDELSGLDVVEHFRSSEVLTLAQVKACEDWVKVDGKKSRFTYTVNPDERFIVYVHVVDKSGNEIYLSSDGIILDETLPDIETIAPEVTVKPKEQPINGIYSGDVKVDLTVTDPIKKTVYSGLKSITYEIYNNSVSVDEPTQQGTLFTYDITAKKQSDLVQKYDKDACIVVDCEKNNSNDVTIKITAVDNSNNVTVSTCDVMIDTTASVIDISYDNNSADSKSYFDANRTATITVTERNFVAEDVVVKITNTDGKAPELSAWKKIKGTGNLDDTKWISTIKYAEDGDYTFDISYTDKAGLECKKVNFAEGTVAAKSFTIDKTVPVVSVTYNNNKAVNGNYYDASRVATIVVDEHNFNADRAVFSLIATDDGSNISKPQVTKWVTDGDKHTCNIYYSADAKYEFDISINDKAGNAAKDYAADTFFVDTQNPEIEITNIENNSANSGKVAPVIRFSDTNFDRSNVKVIVNGSNRGGLSADSMGGYSDTHNGVVFSFNNFAEEKSVDDIYTINVSLTDKAGRTTSKSVTFSVNRFGSVYTLSKELAKLIDKYAPKTEDIVITETNPNKLSNIKLTLFKNGETITLEEGVDFKIDILGGNGSWYRYVYTIFKNNFVDDGVYNLSIHSEDSAGNIAENTLDTKDTEINFGIDKTKPTINVKNVESKETYALDMLKVNLSAKDNLSLKSVVIELDGTKYAEWSGDELKALIDAGADMTFDISGDSTRAHTIKVIAVDEAGNEQVEGIEDFYVTTNLWVRYYTNKPLFFGSIGGAVLLMGIIVFIIVKKKKKDEK